MEKRITLDITGMTCNHCVMNIKKTLLSEPKVRSADVDLVSKEARISGDADIDSNDLISAVKELGYGAAVQSPRSGE